MEVLEVVWFAGGAGGVANITVIDCSWVFKEMKHIFVKFLFMLLKMKAWLIKVDGAGMGQLPKIL